MKKINMYCMIALLTLIFPLISFTQEKSSIYEGVWRSASYGETLEIKRDSVFVYQENMGKLFKRQFTDAVINGNFLTLKSTDVPFGGVTTYQIMLSNDILSLLENHSSTVYNYYKIDNLPEIITPNKAPKTNLEYFWNMHYERYPYFKERNIDWDQARSKMESFYSQPLDDDTLFEQLKSMVDLFKNDGHIWIAREIDEDFEFYTPLHNNPTQSIRPKKDLMFLIGEKYLDNHQYNTIANGKIIYKYLPDNIGYVFISSFFGMTDQQDKKEQLIDLRNSLDSLYTFFKTADGLIIDVRYNGGGNDWAALTCAGLFCSKDYPVISKRPRIQASNNYGSPHVSRVSALRKNLSDKPTVVLSSKFSVSATETFLIAMKNAPNAISMGESSKGMLSDSYVFELPNGWFFGVYSDKVFSYDGMVYESQGVPVDREIKMAEDDFENNIDTVLEEAISHLNHTQDLELD